MQNKCNNNGSRETGFVSLDGAWGAVGWKCANCGCSNHGCDACSQCGWNRCGEGCAAVVCTGASRSRGCENHDRVRDLSDGCIRNVGHGACAQTAAKPCGQCGAACAQERSEGCGTTDGCGACAQNAQRTCDKRGNAAQERCDSCSKTKACETAGCSGRNHGVGMVWAAAQELDRIFGTEDALCAGTLFPELHKPMNGYCPCACGCQDGGQAAAFAAWELRLYLNTHPDETQEPNYATSFLMDTDGCSGWGWTEDPWPWECRPCSK